MVVVVVVVVVVERRTEHCTVLSSVYESERGSVLRGLPRWQRTHVRTVPGADSICETEVPPCFFSKPPHIGLEANTLLVRQLPQ